MRGKAEQSEELRIYIFILQDFFLKTLPETAKITQKNSPLAGAVFFILNYYSFKKDS